MAETTLELRDVDFSYGDTPILSKVSYNFRSGRLTVICGPNGSGKSTALGVASGQLSPKLGTALLNGKPLTDWTAKARAQVMAMLPQSPEAPAELLVRDLVALGRYSRRRPLASLTEEDKTAIAAGLEATEMADFADRALATLSGGQRQRAWIAMVLAQESQLILLDEPTNHLDIAHAVETMDLLKSLVQDKGKTVVAVLHDVNLMASHADDVVLLADGKVTNAGAFEDVVTEHSITALYGKPCNFGQIASRERPFLVIG